MEKENNNMGIYEELQARGLIAQVTNEPEIREMVNTGKATFYIGFDPTADSLHVGHFMALCLMKRLQMAGNRPVVLVGGGTALMDLYLVLCVVWGLVVITGGSLSVLNDTVMSGSLYYKVFNLFNPFL